MSSKFYNLSFKSVKGLKLFGLSLEHSKNPHKVASPHKPENTESSNSRGVSIGILIGTAIAIIIAVNMIPSILDSMNNLGS